MAAVGTAVPDEGVAAAGELFGREQGPLMMRMPGLAARRALGVAVGRGRLGGLDDVGGRRFGRGRGVLAGLGQLFLELEDSELQGGELGTEVLQLLLQLLAIATGRR